jgi:hypothetical protein
VVIKPKLELIQLLTETVEAGVEHLSIAFKSLRLALSQGTVKICGCVTQSKCLGVAVINQWQHVFRDGTQAGTDGSATVKSTSTDQHDEDDQEAETDGNTLCYIDFHAVTQILVIGGFLFRVFAYLEAVNL